MQWLIIIAKDSKTLFCSSKFPRSRESIYLIFIDDLGTRPENGSPALTFDMGQRSCIVVSVAV
jgi:hypothetical protein